MNRYRKIAPIISMSILLLCVLMLIYVFGITNNENNNSGTLYKEIINNWYENSALVSIKLSEKETANLLLNSNKEAYMENGANIRVYLKNKKAVILTKDVEVISEPNPVEVISAFANNSTSISKGSIKEIDSSISKESINSEYESYRIDGYDEIYNTLSESCNDEYASNVVNSLGLSKDTKVYTELTVYKGVKKLDNESGTYTIECSNMKGFYSAMLVLNIDNVDYVIYSIMTRGVLRNDFILEKGWYNKNNNEQWAKLAVKLSGDIAEMLYK